MNLKSVEKKENSMAELVITVDQQELETAFDKAYKKNRGKISVPGFRKGKAPRKIIESMYGDTIFMEDAINIVYPEAYAAAVEQAGLRTVAYPEVEIVDASKDGMEFKATVALYPEVKLGQYKGLAAVHGSPEVTEEEVNAEVDKLRQRGARLVSVERPVQQGDTAVIDFEGFENGVPFEGGKGEKYSLEIGSGSFVPGFEDQIVGMKAGEERDIDITFPEDYHAELAGKSVVFHVRVHEVKETQLPEADDDLAKDVSSFDTLDALKQDIRDRLGKEKAESVNQEYESALMEQVIANMEAEIPQAMVDTQVGRLVEDYSFRVSSQGLKLEDYLHMMGMTMDDLREQAKVPALHRVQTEVALSAIADAEGIQITAEDLEEEYKRIAEKYNMEVERIKAGVSPDDVASDLKLTRARDVVLSAAVEPAPEETAEDGKEEKKAPRRTHKKTEEKKDAEAVEAEDKGE